MGARGRGGEIRPCNLDTRVSERASERATGRLVDERKFCLLQKKGVLIYHEATQKPWQVWHIAIKSPIT